MLDIQLPGFAGKRPVAQAVERFVVTGAGENFRTTDQAPGCQVLQDKKIILRARALHIGLERGARVEDLFLQARGIVRQRRDTHQAVTGQLLQLRQIG
ncbi:hypothetical protein D3C78_1628750 [compost metagenome]